MSPTADHPEIHPGSREEWRAWLAEHHATARGVWVVSHKKSSGQQRVPYDDYVEEALCFGWIDSLLKPVDDQRSKQLFTPRKRGSAWARSNKQRVQRLIDLGLMTEAGLRVIEQAKQDGSWTVLDSVEELQVPTDLAQALAANPPAAGNFAGFAPSARKGALWWIASAKRPETRARRIAEVARLAAEGRTLTS